MSHDLSARRKLEARARRLGVVRPDLLTLDELEAEVARLTAAETPRPERPKGWLGVARDLLASVVEQGLHLPDAAALIRGDTRPLERKPIAPVPTVTLAEIYAAQGHTARALATVDEVLAREPAHEAAQRLQRRLRAALAEKEARHASRASGATAPTAPPPAEDSPRHVGDSPPASPVEVSSLAAGAPPPPGEPLAPPGEAGAAAECPALASPRLHLLSLAAGEIWASWDLGGLGCAAARLEVVHFEAHPAGAQRVDAAAQLAEPTGAQRFLRPARAVSRARLVLSATGRTLVVAVDELAQPRAGDPETRAAFERARARR
ncbi:MAG: hypothetical protein IT376_05060 [Polyangiaceae bacterium]|nr:hypothetical protein [Polyangiaceae bacterium]